ncbi:MAG: SpaH/EbpB family LPXTG-anchored major pilin [Eubacteriales bacterium]|nr:SpaH/EbpB family LPXTG-anchored major pilin [Eubacteriales bacterium]
MKKLFALLLALTMVFGLAATGYAAEFDPTAKGTIKIENAVVGATYHAYRLLALESFNDDTPDDTNGGQYTYKLIEDSPWNTFLTGATVKNVYLTIDDQDYVTWADGADAAEFAKLAQAFAADSENGITADKTETAATTTVEMTDLALGYYLVDTSMGSLCSLNTTDYVAEIKEKNEAPEIEKTVKENTTKEYGESNTAGVGEVVEFQATITAKKGAQNYILHDKMDAGLTFIDVTSVTLNGTALAENTDYTVTAPGDETDNPCTFHVTILKELKENESVVVNYTARVNENAVVTDPFNKNEAKVEYGDNHFTEPDTTVTKVFDVDILKYTMAGAPAVETGLAGAIFELANTDAAGYTPINFVEESTNVYEACFNTQCTHASHVTQFTTPENGKFTLKGLDAGTYYLHEIKAPDGYNKLAGPVTITIDENGKVNATTDEPNGVEEVKVLNQSGTELPSTGGVGTTLFYIFGGILMVGAVVLLITKKRMNA